MSQEDQNKQKDLGRLHSNAINGTHIWRKKGEKEALTNITTLICAKFNHMVLGPWKFCRPSPSSFLLTLASTQRLSISLTQEMK